MQGFDFSYANYYRTLSLNLICFTEKQEENKNITVSIIII
jgi:hypothetical protein